MPKFFCDYCDVYLTHDSMSVRKAHNSGRNHLRNVVDYYQQIGHEKAQSVIDSITNSYAAEGQSANNPMLNTAPPGFGPPGGMVPPAGLPPGFPMPPGGMPPGFPAGAYMRVDRWTFGYWILTLYRHAAAPTRPATRIPTTSWHAQLPTWYVLLLGPRANDMKSDKFDRYASSSTRHASWIPATRRSCRLSTWRHAVPTSGYGASRHGRATWYASLPG